MSVDLTIANSLLSALLMVVVGGAALNPWLALSAGMRVGLATMGAGFAMGAAPLFDDPDVGLMVASQLLTHAGIVIVIARVLVLYIEPVHHAPPASRLPWPTTVWGGDKR